ncbi:putative TNF receptor-associated factor 4 [Paratrimastix pyriformis]|uniref:TNF receptor-associated factor 4 n=1 Tax=Paratrimastix pyriformis TaxID=342808 RepID=A0ABQ8UAT5_9EUKA|nr:putative TNF receptor-associated factor 4 [Paratrimastix pyriformis]
MAEEGYPTERFSKPSEIPAEFICIYCACVMRNPVSHLCPASHKGCEACARAWLGRSRTCPSCRCEVPPQAPQRDVTFANLISRLEISCKNRPSGCPWKGQVEKLTEHESQCDCHPVACSNEGCHQQIPACGLQDHVIHCPFRKVVCEFCHSQMTQQALAAHLTTCPSAARPCPHGCGGTVLRDGQPAHDAVCPLVIVPCPVPGCPEKALRKDMERHLLTNLMPHMRLLAAPAPAPSPPPPTPRPPLLPAPAPALAKLEATTAELLAANAELRSQVTALTCRLTVAEAELAELQRVSGHPVVGWSERHKSAEMTVTEGRSLVTVTGEDGLNIVAADLRAFSIMPMSFTPSSSVNIVLLTEDKVSRGAVEVTILVDKTQGSCYCLGLLPAIPETGQYRTGFGWIGRRTGALKGWGMCDDGEGIFCQNTCLAKSRSRYTTEDLVRMRVDIDRGDLVYWVNDAQCAELRDRPEIRAGGFLAGQLFNKSV